MDKKHRRLMLRVGTALRISPFLIIMGMAGSYAFSTFSGMINDEVTLNELQDTIVSDEETQEVIDVTPSPTIKPTPMPSASPTPIPITSPTPKVVKEENEVKREKLIPKREREYKISNELLNNGYNFQNIDFETLKDINPDSCAWICVDGTNINLPIVQGEDNEYYLKHDIEGNSSKYGTLYVDYRNKPLDVQNKNLSDLTIIYGHHITGGRMLAQICNYKEQSYYDSHKFGVVYTPDGYAYEAEFFAGTIVDGKDEANILIDQNMSELEYKEYIEKLKSESTFKSDVKVEYKDKILALVTCSYETNNSRYVLYAVLNKQYTNDYQLNQNQAKSLVK